MPPRRRLAFFTVVLLLIGIVDGHRHVRISSLTDAPEYCVKAVDKELSSLLFPIMAVRVSDELLRLGCEHRGDQ